MNSITTADVEKVLNLYIKNNETPEEIEKNFLFLDKNFSVLYDFILSYLNYVNRNKSYSNDFEELSMIEAHILLDIVNSPTITVTELAQKWKKTTSAISQTLKKLIKKEYVYREISSVNAKFFLLHPTEKGKKFTLQHKHYDNIDIVKTIKKLNKNFSSEEIAVFYRIMIKFTEILNSNNKKL